MDFLQQADAALGQGDFEGAISSLSTSIRTLTAAGDNRGASRACARLGGVFAGYLGNRVAAEPWFRRAIRLVEDEPPCLEQGWAALAALGCEVDDPDVLSARADLALDRARQFGDLDLEIKALADGGLARVQAGRVRDGMTMLDEAMALTCAGGTEDQGMVGSSVCSFYTACYQTADFERADTWSELLRQNNLLGDQPGAPAMLSSHCESVRGMVLFHLGRWTEAEQVLERALDAIERAMPGAAWHPPIALAELRILQGRLNEAEALLLGKDDRIQALVPMARLHLARGDLDLACATARRGLRLLGDDRIRSAALSAVLVEAQLLSEDIPGAVDSCRQMETLIDGLGLPALSAEAARVRAQVLLAQGEGEEAQARLQRGIDQLAGARLPLIEARLLMDLARLHDEHGEVGDAKVAGRTAASLISQLDINLSGPDADLLRRLGTEPTGDPGCRVATLKREGGRWLAGCEEQQVRLRHSKGLRYLAELLASPATERHALDLVDLVEGVGRDGADRHRLGDAGPNLDASARAAYRRQAALLRDEVEDALAREDDETAARLQAQLDDLVAQLASAFGLGGRDRKAASAAERARLNVTRALRTAIASIADGLPEAAAVLDRRVRTGTFCAYEPAPEDRVLWTAPGS